MSAKYHWLKERYNPQLGTYYVPLGNISTKEALSYKSAKYGNNTLHKFPSKDSYEAHIENLKAAGARFI